LFSIRSSDANRTHAINDAEPEFPTGIVKLWCTLIGIALTIGQTELPATLVTMAPIIIGVAALAPSTLIVAFAHPALTAWFRIHGLAYALSLAGVPLAILITTLDTTAATHTLFAWFASPKLDAFVPGTPLTTLLALTEFDATNTTFS
jgi:hypothetical protein